MLLAMEGLKQGFGGTSTPRLAATMTLVPALPREGAA